MVRRNYIELGRGAAAVRIPILYEDRAVLAIDKPHGWMLAPSSWHTTGRNLQAAFESSIAARDFWARSRNLKFLRFVHRLDAETTGALLMVKSPGAVKPYSHLFESRAVEKVYLAVVRGPPKQTEWVCRLKLASDPMHRGKVRVDQRGGKEAETHFRVLQTRPDAAPGAVALIEARPSTGRTHQIRVHLAASGHPALGDMLYGGGAPRTRQEQNTPLGLRAIRMVYTDPFANRRVQIVAPADKFIREFGFSRSQPDAGEKPPGPGGRNWLR